MHLLTKSLYFFLACILLTGSLASCTPSPEKAAHKAQFMAMGTLVDIAIWGSDDQADQAINDVMRIMNNINKTWHAWQPSALTQLNKNLQTSETAIVSRQLLPLLKQAKLLSQKSQGYFEPNIGALSQLWGFQQDSAPSGPPPSPTEINALLERTPSISTLVFSDDTVTRTNAHIQLDLGAIAKGYAVDLGIQRLKELGIKNAIINAGGDLRAIGAHGKRAWRIGVRDPRPSQQGGILASIDTQNDESVFTSGDYERYFIYENKRYHHILNPKTGYPSKDFTSVTVIHNNATEADAIATALMVAGKAHWQEVARSMQSKNILLIDTEDRIILTPAMKERVHFLKETSSIEIITP